MDKALIQELKTFLRERNFSISFAVKNLPVSRGTLSKILHGKIGCLSKERQDVFGDSCRTWMDGYYEAEYKLYTSAFDIFKNANHIVIHQVLNQLGRDL